METEAIYMNSQDFDGVRRLLSLASFALLAGAAVLIAGCGGESNGGNAGPTATPTQQAESTPQPSSGNVALFLTAGNFDTISVALNPGDTLRIEYKAESVIVGAGNVSNLAQAGAVMAVNDPSENQIYLGEQKTEDEVELTAETEGEHRIIFQNPFPLQAQQVTVTYSINE
jgi:hypothetical protein